VGLDRNFDLKIEDGGRLVHRTDAGFACIAPQQVHQILAEEMELAYLYVDTSPVAYARWLEQGGAPMPPDDAILGELRGLARSATPDTSRSAAIALARRWHHQALPGLASIQPTDPRIAHAVAMIDAHPAESLNYASLAHLAHLSPSRFANLFREQTGLPVRNYLLWRRLVFALECLERGDSITAAAHNAGFSDCAHLSRSFHRICGTMPSNIKFI
jgi:AraC-like DNA-binding protein